MATQSIVITGASTGIGEATALHLDGLGFQVFAGVRRPADGEALKARASARLNPILLDLTDAASIARAQAIVEEVVGEQGLAGLVNNAGIVVGSPLEFLPLDDLRRQFEVNVIGQLAVTQAFLPLIRKAKGRIVNMGSQSGRVANLFMGPYAMSKFALEAMTSSLRQELKEWGIHVALVGPGAVATPIWRKSLAEADQRLAAMPAQALAYYGDMIDAVRRYQASRGDGGVQPIAVARAVAHALTAPRPRTSYRVGSDARLAELLRLLPDSVRERLIARKLFGR